MDHLDEISVDDLQNALGNAEGKKPTHRLLAAIAYKNGVPQIELAGWCGVERKTIYSCLTRLDTDESREQTVTNVSCPREDENSQRQSKSSST